MIVIEERQTVKMPGITSLFVSFNFNQSVIDSLKKLSHYTYDPKTKLWEIPLTCLSAALTDLTNFDDITLKLLCTDKNENPEIIKLGTYKFEPFEHQVENIQYALQKGHEKFLLLDCPGAGKTNTIIGIGEELKKREGIEHCLVICGVNTLKMNWRKEILKFSDLGCRVLGERVNKKGKITIGSVKDRIADLNTELSEFFLIVNIETLRNEDFIKALKKSPNKIDFIAADEVHKFGSNPQSLQSKGLMKLNAKHIVAATGTLLTNNPTNAFLPLKWIGAERGTFTNFKYYYCNYTGQFNNILIGYRNLPILKDQISKNSIRHTKDILNLPQKNIINELVEMEPNQEKLYNNIKNGIVDEVDKVELNTSTILSMITRLRQATSCPSMLSSSDVESSKINRACDLAEEILDNGEKVVIFSVFKETLNVLSEKLKEYNPLLCTGDVKETDRADSVNKFQNDDTYKIMLATVQAMGTGITLTSASNEIFIDCTFTRAQNLQAEDRIHRIGSSKPVFIYYLWNDNTIDVHVKDIVDSKEAISDFIVDDKCPPHLTQKLREIVLDLKNS